MCFIPLILQDPLAVQYRQNTYANTFQDGAERHIPPHVEAPSCLNGDQGYHVP